ncbi:profilin-1 [Chaetodon auriga]|uniref:profilin-1 n=1 Tax=Chaetodon auriga TaxID=39042 RepID=UPI004032C1C8
MYKRQLVFLLSAFHFSPSSSYLRLYLHRIRMTWQAYIDDLMSVDEQTGTIPVMDAAICGTEVGQQSVWASSPGLSNITAEEIKRLIGDRPTFHSSGPVIGGRKCMLLRDQMDDDTSYALNLKTKADEQGVCFSVCVGKSKSALVIAFGNKDAQGGQLVKKVYKVVKHLRESNM